MYKWKSGGKECEMCERRVDETDEHLMLKCEGYEGARDRLLGVATVEIGVEV